MNTTTKLMGITVLAAALAAGCTGNLPTGTGTAGQPGFNGRLTLNGNGVKDRTVFLKQFNGVSAGSFGNSAHVGDQYTAKTDDNGNFFLPVPANAVSGGGLYGVGYDASANDANKKTAAGNPNEIQWFTTPAVDLSKNSTVSVNVELGWAASAFTPKDGTTVSGKTVNFSLPSYPGATQYEVLVLNGNVAGSGSQAFDQKSDKAQITWDNAANGTYNYSGKVFTTSGVAGVQASSPALVFSVTGAQ